ncbi:MAG: hypothetical protein H3C62_00760 [Gemmatimonadaceae bacterium]|nr:hypothetical protein [Gemmatimonadaceae bacterium]
MLLVPLQASNAALRVHCAACHRSVRAASAFAEIGAPEASYRCLTDALESGTPVVLSLPVRILDADVLRRASQRLLAGDGGESADATVVCSLADALYECVRSQQLPRDLGLQVRYPTASVGVLAGDGLRATWSWASRLDLVLQVQLIITDIGAFHLALDAFGPRAAYGDPTEYLGHALRAFLAFPVDPSTLGFVLQSYTLAAAGRTHD